eukprot:Sspe_Gene.21177::Locus_7894_Transcript_1_1_Confidence_1.000_Length_1666::g.21177::m.21177
MRWLAVFFPTVVCGALWSGTGDTHPNVPGVTVAVQVTAPSLSPSAVEIAVTGPASTWFAVAFHTKEYRPDAVSQADRMKGAYALVVDGRQCSGGVREHILGVATLGRQVVSGALLSAKVIGGSCEVVFTRPLTGSDYSFDRTAYAILLACGCTTMSTAVGYHGMSRAAVSPAGRALEVVLTKTSTPADTPLALQPPAAPPQLGGAPIAIVPSPVFQSASPLAISVPTPPVAAAVPLASEDDNEGLSDEEIAGIVLGSLAGGCCYLLCICAVLYVLLRKQRGAPESKHQEGKAEEGTAGTAQELSGHFLSTTTTQTTTQSNGGQPVTTTTMTKKSSLMPSPRVLRCPRCSAATTYNVPEGEERVLCPFCSSPFDPGWGSTLRIPLLSPTPPLSAPAATPVAMPPLLVPRALPVSQSPCLAPLQPPASSLPALPTHPLPLSQSPRLSSLTPAPPPHPLTPAPDLPPVKMFPCLPPITVTTVASNPIRPRPPPSPPPSPPPDPPSPFRADAEQMGDAIAQLRELVSSLLPLKSPLPFDDPDE